MTAPFVIAILRGITPAEVRPVGEALLSAGIDTIEVPMNSPNVFESIAEAARIFAGRATIGAGTVLKIEQIDKVIEAGGTFIVSPNCNPVIIAETRRRGLASYPGVFTPTEAFAAIDAGASALKIFPADTGGPAHIKAMTAVIPREIPLVGVGGTGPNNFAEYVAAGCSGFALANFLFRPGFSPEKVHARAVEVVEALALLSV